MKKIFAFTVAAFALLVVSCNKEVAPETTVLPEEIEAPATVTRTFAVSAPVDTKTGLGEGNKVVWSTGDKILVIAKTTGNTAEFTLNSGAGSANATFKGELAAADSEETEFYAVYPANLYAAPDANPTTVEFSKPYSDASQPLLAVAGSFDSKFANMTAVLEGGKFTFRHASAYFKLTVGQDGIKSIKISSDGGARIYGRQVVTLSTGAVGTVNGSKSSENFITLAPSEGTFANGGVYYVPFSVKSGSSFGNITITATNTADVECSLTTSSISSKKPEAGLVYNFKTPTFDFSTEPVLTLAKTSISAGSDAVTNGTAESAYTLKNCTDSDVTVTFDGTVVTAASVAGGTVTYSVSANTGAAREGWIGFQVPGSAVQKITVNQNAAGAKETHVWDFGSTDWQNYLETNEPTVKDAQIDGYSWSVTHDGLTYISGNKDKWSVDGYIQPNGKGSTTSRCFKFTVASAGKLTVTVTNPKNTEGSSSTRVVKVKDSSTTHTSDSVLYPDQVTREFDIAAGDVIVYPDGNGLRFFKIEFEGN